VTRFTPGVNAGILSLSKDSRRIYRLLALSRRPLPHSGPGQPACGGARCVAANRLVSRDPTLREVFVNAVNEVVRDGKAVS